MKRLLPDLNPAIYFYRNNGGNQLGIIEYQLVDIDIKSLHNRGKL